MMDYDLIPVRSREEALDALAKYEDDARVIAGGQSLLNILKQGLMAPEILIDIKGIQDLDGLQFGESLRIGSVTSHRTLELSGPLAEKFPLLCEMERNLATVQIRNWGTIGGNLCIADPSSDPAPCLLAYDAKAVVATKAKERIVPLTDFWVDYYETVLEPDELLVEVEVPSLGPGSGAAYEKFRNVEGDAPIIVVAVRFTLDPAKKACKEVRIALGGTAPVPLRATGAEAVLSGEVPTAEALEEAARIAATEISPIPDITASVEFKTKLVQTLVKRVGTRALERAGAALGG
ncbi:MAG: FAD binding domain-containing protein [Planctomycetota bacterium]|jgi:carbon-monoxide dehydrogenase medium subunit